MPLAHPRPTRVATREPTPMPTTKASPVMTGMMTTDTPLTASTPAPVSADPPAPQAGEPPRSRGRVARLFLGGQDAPRWARPALWALLVATAVLYLWNLSASGYANDYYAA